MTLEEIKRDKFFITEILNDIYRNDYVEGGKAATMLKDWSAELREKARAVMPPSRLHRTFNKEVGAQNW